MVRRENSELSLLLQMLYRCSTVMRAPRGMDDGILEADVCVAVHSYVHYNYLLPIEVSNSLQTNNALLFFSNLSTR